MNRSYRVLGLLRDFSPRVVLREFGVSGRRASGFYGFRILGFRF